MQRTLLTFIAAVLMLSAPGWAQTPSKEKTDKIRSLYAEARQAGIAKEYGKATEILHQIIELLPDPDNDGPDPNYANTYYHLAGNYALQNNKKKAIESLGLAVQRGYWNHQMLERDPTFKALRDEKEFAVVLERSRRGLAEMAFGLADLEGKKIQKGEYKGKALIIDVWGTWCPPCRNEIPHFVKLQERYGKEGLAIIGLTWEKRLPDESVRKKVAKFAKDYGINYRLALIPRGVLRSIPQFSGFPTTIYVGRDGLVEERLTGAETYPVIEQRALKVLKTKPADRKD